MEGKDNDLEINTASLYNQTQFSGNPLQLEYKETIIENTSGAYNWVSGFDVFTLMDGSDTYIVYICKDAKSINFYSLNTNKVIKELPDIEPNKGLDCCIHYGIKQEKKDYVITTSAKNTITVISIQDNFSKVLSIENAITESG